MKIDSYSFGNIEVEGKKFSKDLIVFPLKIRNSWWRKNGHILQNDDLMEIYRTRPDVLVVGTGQFGKMKISQEVRDQCKSLGIELIEEQTPYAIKTFNKIENKVKVGAFHITC